MNGVPTDENVTTFLQKYAGLSEPDAETFVEALKVTALEEVLGTIVGDEPVPTSVVELRSLRLRRLSANLKRNLTHREIAAVFRISRQQAAALSKRMEATYPQAVNGFRRESVRATVDKIELPAGALNTGAVVKVHFKEASGRVAAKALIDDAEVAADADYTERLLTLTAGSSPDEAYDILDEVLGLGEFVQKARDDAASSGRPTGVWKRRTRR